MNPDKEFEKYQHFLEEAQKHTQPSPETLRRFDKIDNYIEKAEINHSDIKVHLGKQDILLKQILEQATKTNGRVNCLEGWKNENGDFIKDLKENKKENQKRFWDYAWRIGFALFIIMWGTMNVEQFVELFK